MRRPLHPVFALVLGCAPAPDDPPDDTAPPPCTPSAWFADEDGDGFGDPGDWTISCTPVLHAVDRAGDCDDADPLVHPDAPDDDCDGRDDDCDGQADQDAPVQTWYADTDGDGVGGAIAVFSCAALPGFTLATGDCDDGDPEVYPGAPERCNAVDDDCDGWIDPSERDGDGDGVAPCAGDCDDADPARHPGAPERCNRSDDDCDLAIPLDEFDLDLDGQTPCEGDCDDADPLVFAGGIEQVADGLDGDCDGTELCFLDADGDGAGSLQHTVSLDLDCEDPGESDQSLDCDDLDPLVAGGLPEIPWDGVDNDCDPLTPDDDLDGDGWPVAQDCDDLDPTVRPDNPPPTWFEDRTLAAGLAQVHWDPSADPPICGSEGMSGGASAADYDNDGWIDLFLPRQHRPDQLFHNQGDGTFVDVAPAAGVDHAGTTSMGLWFDMDADGDLDLLAVSSGDDLNRLYRNEGDGTFVELPGAGGLEMPFAPGESCSWIYGASAADVDGDGDLDVHTAQWHPEGGTGDRSRLFLNDGLGNFTDTTATSGLDLSARSAFAASFGDVDGDGDPDLALAADWGTSGLWQNDGTGVFTEITLAAGVGTDENGMGSALADYDGDGDLDWFVTAIYDADPTCPWAWGCSGNRLYVNDGLGQFADQTDAAGVRDGAWGWGAAFFDADNDGDLDLGHAAGFAIDPRWEDGPNRLFLADGAGAFVERACERGLLEPADAKAFLPFDADNDGDLDLLLTSATGEPRLYQNRGAEARSWLRVQVGEPGNPFGIGAVVEVQALAGGPVQRRWIDANSRYLSTGPPEAPFGLADHESPLYEVRVRWPDGGLTVLAGVSPRQILTVQR